MRTSSSRGLLWNCRREMVGMLAGWFLVASWVIGYCWIDGYAAADEVPTTTLGFPTWVVYGVIVPWLASTVLTCWFALSRMADDRLGDTGEIDQAASLRSDASDE